MKVLMFFGPAALAVVLASCATGNAPRMGQMLKETTGQNGRACIQLDDIQSYGVLEGGVISIDSMDGNYYLATVLPGCVDLQTSARALFSGDFGEVCGQTADSIVTGGDRCSINHIFEFDNRKEAFDTYNQILEKRKAMKSSSQY
jgi:hypothetical protein